MVKLALCFSGDTRTYNLCFDTIKQQLLEKYDCDIFISTYETDVKSKQDLLNIYNPKAYNFYDRNQIQMQMYNHINTSLKRVKQYNVGVHGLSFEASKNINVPEDCFMNYEKHKTQFVYGKLYVNSLCQFYGMYDVSELCKKYILDNGITYDYIIRLRFDDIIYGTFNIDEFNLQENEMVINTFHNYSDSVKINDHFFMTKQNTYFKISNLYANINYVIETINTSKCWLPMSGYQETLLLIHALLGGVKIKECSNCCIIKLGYTFENEKWKKIKGLDTVSMPNPKKQPRKLGLFFTVS